MPLAPRLWLHPTQTTFLHISVNNKYIFIFIRRQQCLINIPCFFALLHTPSKGSVTNSCLALQLHKPTSGEVWACHVAYCTVPPGQPWCFLSLSVPCSHYRLWLKESVERGDINQVSCGEGGRESLLPTSPWNDRAGSVTHQTAVAGEPNH